MPCGPQETRWSKFTPASQPRRFRSRGSGWWPSTGCLSRPARPTTMPVLPFLLHPRSHTRAGAHTLAFTLPAISQQTAFRPFFAAAPWPTVSHGVCLVTDSGGIIVIASGKTVAVELAVEPESHAAVLQNGFDDIYVRTCSRFYFFCLWVVVVVVIVMVGVSWLLLVGGWWRVVVVVSTTVSVRERSRSFFSISLFVGRGQPTNQTPTVCCELATAGVPLPVAAFPRLLVRSQAGTEAVVIEAGPLRQDITFCLADTSCCVFTVPAVSHCGFTL